MILDDLYKVLMLHAAWTIIYEYAGLMEAFVVGMAIVLIVIYIVFKNWKDLINDRSDMQGDKE